MCEDIINTYEKILDKSEIKEQKKRKIINADINKKKNKNKEDYEKNLNENKFKNNLQKIKDILIDDLKNKN